ncbi:MAG: TetR family transcriptional regulator [Pseudonocardiaceae bacterium]|nr:TetR family transcriptional regulator [Pseudonocardiaceae bacterium]
MRDVAKQRGARGEHSTSDLPKSARTRERILDAAAKVLARNGYAGTRLSDIAELAEVQAPALYYYFSSREELIEEVMTLGQHRTFEYVRSALDALPDDATPMDRICEAVGAHLEVGLQLSDFASATIRNGGQLPPDMRERQLVEQHSYGDLWRQLFEDARKAGEINPALDPSAVRMLVLGAMNWSPEWWDPGRGSLRSLITTAQTLVRQGLSAPPG